MGYYSNSLIEDYNTEEVLTFNPYSLLFKYMDADEAAENENVMTQQIYESDDEFIEKVTELFSFSESFRVNAIKFKYENKDAKNAVSKFQKISNLTRKQLSL